MKPSLSEWPIASYFALAKSASINFLLAKDKFTSGVIAYFVPNSNYVILPSFSKA
jgi:hypothetical protein